MTGFERVALSVALALSLVGCRTDKEILDAYEAHLLAGSYSGALGEVKSKAEDGGGSEQLWRLLAGSADFLLDDKGAAVEQFDAAERAFQRNDTSSVFARGGEGALAMMTNDKAFDYDGGGLEREFTCVYRCIDFLAAGRRDAARVELNRASQYQTNWLVGRQRDIQAAEQKLARDVAAYERQQGSQSNGRSASVTRAMNDASFAGQIRAKTGFDPTSSGDLARLAQRDYMNSYVSHLTGVFRWLAGDSDRNELKEAAEYSPDNPIAKRDFTERRQGVRPVNQVWVYVEDGLCPCREEWRFDLPLMFIPFAGRYVKYAGMALPYLRYRSPGANRWQVGDGRMVCDMVRLEDIDRLVKVEYDVYMRGALAREITRTIVKIGAQVALEVAAENCSDDNTRLALRLSQWGVAAWAISTTAADLRSWTALPKSVYLHRLDRPSSGVIDIMGDGQLQVRATVPEGNSIIFIRKPAAPAPAVVKVVTF